MNTVTDHRFGLAGVARAAAAAGLVLAAAGAIGTVWARHAPTCVLLPAQPDGTNNGCNGGPSDCWTQEFQVFIQLCADSHAPGTDGYSSCICEAINTLELCLREVCFEFDEIPTAREQCINQYKNSAAACDTTFPNDTPGHRALREACKQGAARELTHCLAHAPNTTCAVGQYGELIILTGITQSASASFSNAQLEGTFELSPVPAIGCGADLVVVEAMLSDGRGSVSWVTLDTAGENADGWIIGAFDLTQIPNLSRYTHVEAFATWYQGGEPVYAVSVEISIEESGVAGDFDRDGQKSISDLTAYTDSYIEGVPRADRTGEGDVTGDDLVQFINEYAQPQ